MLVVLQTSSDGGPGRRVQLRSDQVLKVGRSGWADFCVAGDPHLMEIHFEVCCAPQGCLVRGLSPDAPTLINGNPIEVAVAYDGDEIQAGATKFRLVIDGGPIREMPAEPEPVVETPAPTPTPAAVGAVLGLAGVCAYLEFADDVTALADRAASADEMIAELATREKFQDALRLRAYLLEKRQAVWWGCHCLREELDEPLPEDQTAAVDSAADWVEDPCESRRRAAEAKAGDAKYSGPGASLALSAFWSDGSLAPDGSPEVEADKRLTSQGVAAALVAAAYVGDPTTAPDRFKAFLKRGQDMADGQIPFPRED